MTAKYIILATALCFAAVLAKSPSDKELTENEKKIADLKHECENNLANAEKVINAPTEFSKCINNDSMEKKFKNSKNSNKTENKEMLERFCTHISYKRCLNDFTSVTKDCYTPKVRNQVQKVNNEVIVHMIESICNKTGTLESIALFLSESGYDCIENKTKEINKCWSDTLGPFQDAVYNLRIPFDDEHCKTITTFKTCLLGELNNCSKIKFEPIVNELLTIPCKTYLEKVVAGKDNKNTSDPNIAVTTTTQKSATTTKNNTVNLHLNTTDKPKTNNQKKKGSSASGLAVTSTTIIMAVVTATLL